MSNINVGLTINIIPLDGYTATTATDGKVYYYKYSGGSDGNGNVTEYTDDGSGQGTITVTATSPSYPITGVTFTGDTHGDLSWAFGSSNLIAVITDTNVDNENASFCVTATDPQANCTFNCDPGITNKPKPD